MLHYKFWIKDGGTIQGMKLCLPLHPSVVANEKGAFGLSLTKVTNFSFLQLTNHINKNMIWH